MSLTLCAYLQDSFRKERNRTAKQNVRLEEHFSKFGNHEVIKEKLSSNYWNRIQILVFQNIRIPNIVIKCSNPPENVAIFLTLELKLRWENDTSICIKKKHEKQSFGDKVVLLKRRVQEGPYYVCVVCSRSLYLT